MTFEEWWKNESGWGGELLAEGNLAKSAWEAATKQNDIDPIVQVSGFGVENTMATQTNFMIVGLTASGKVVISAGDGLWADVSPPVKQSLTTEASEDDF